MWDKPFVFSFSPLLCRFQVLYSCVLISLTLHGRHAFTTAGVRLKQKFSFSNFCLGRGLNPGPRSLIAVNVTTRLRRHPQVDSLLKTLLLKKSYPDPSSPYLLLRHNSKHHPP